MIIKLFQVIGLIVAWVVHCLAISPIVALANIIGLIAPLLPENRIAEIGEWQWPNKYETIITKITGVKV